MIPLIICIISVTLVTKLNAVFRRKRGLSICSVTRFFGFYSRLYRKLTSGVNQWKPAIDKDDKIMTTQGIERIPDSLGYLVINEDGAVLSSGGDLENDERLADRIMNLVHKSLQLVNSPDKPTTFRRVSVMWDDFMYAVTISNHKVYVSKRRHLPTDPAVA